MRHARRNNTVVTDTRLFFRPFNRPDAMSRERST